jgi:hypothetical protein
MQNIKRNRSLRLWALALVICSALCGCTQNQRARSFGGTATVELPAGRKLVNATFKQDNLWILTRAAKPDEKPEAFELTEDSSFGLIEGKVIIREK